jgi:hypothetical protein
MTGATAYLISINQYNILYVVFQFSLVSLACLAVKRRASPMLIASKKFAQKTDGITSYV